MASALPIRRFRLLPVAQFLLVVTLTLPLVAGFVHPAAVEAATATIDTDALRLRGGPGTGYSVITLMYDGESVEILAGPTDGWYQVRYRSSTGWAFGDYLAIVDDGSGAGTATIDTTWLRLRTGPGTTYSVITRMYQGESVAILDGPSAGWYQVRYGTSTGWAFGDYLNFDDVPTLPSSATVATNVLNLRSGAGTGFAILDRMLYGETVTIQGSSGAWYQVNHHGQSGWAFGDYLSLGGDSASFWVPTHQQEHSLSCEYASLQIATAALGNAIPEDEFIPVVGLANNPHNGFRGDIDASYIFGVDDYGVYPEALAAALPAFGFTGEVFYGGPARLKAHLREGHPVLVWIDNWMDSSFAMNIDGELVTMAPGSHVVVAYGFTSEGVLISDPDSSVRKRLIPWTEFQTIWSSMDQMALAVSA